MSYKNAKDILPPDLLKQVQKYICGEQVYIPQPHEVKRKWGQKTGTRAMLSFRNKEIQDKHKQGASMDELADLFCLSLESIRKIIYQGREKENG